jgi:hypothetical protein
LNGDGAERLLGKTKAVKGERVGNEVDGETVGCAVVGATVGANGNI